jgi:hypothetical protein
MFLCIYIYIYIYIYMHIYTHTKGERENISRMVHLSMHDFSTCAG